MPKEEILDYLKSTGLYKNESMFYEKNMIEPGKSIPVSELVERFVEIDKAYNGSPWNIKQILNNINMIIPLEDR